MITIGLLLSYVVAYALEPAGAWRWMMAVGIAPALLLLGGMFLVPESPDWLRSRGHGERAALAAARLGIGTGAAPRSRLRARSAAPVCAWPARGRAAGGWCWASRSPSWST